MLDRTSARPMCLQLCDLLRQRIVSRSFPPGYRLPSTRSLAARLRISRNTVLNAYEELAAEGLVRGRVGSGTRVCGNVSKFPHSLVPKIPDARFLLRQAHYPVAAAGICDLDGTKLVVREDDRAEVVSERLRAYDRQTTPVLECLRSEGYEVWDVDGASAAPPVIAQQIQDQIQSWMGAPVGVRRKEKKA